MRVLSCLATLFLAAPALAEPLIANGRYESSCYDGPQGYTKEAWVFQSGRDFSRFFHESGVYRDADCLDREASNAPAGNFVARPQGFGSLLELDLFVVRPEGTPPQYTVIDNAGDVIYFGILTAERDGSAPTRRPTDVDTTKPFTFVP